MTSELNSRYARKDFTHERNEAEATASVYTHNGRLKRRLEQLERDRPVEVSRDHAGDFIIPKGWIKINPTRILTEEQRQQMAARFKH